MRRFIVTAVAAAAVASSLGVAQASPYDAVLAHDAAIITPTHDIIEMIQKIIDGPGKREWVLHDPTMAVGTWTVEQGPNGMIVHAGVGDALVGVSAVKEISVPGRLTEFVLALQVPGVTSDIAADVDGDGDTDLVWSSIAR